MSVVKSVEVNWDAGRITIELAFSPVETRETLREALRVMAPGDAITLTMDVKLRLPSGSLVMRGLEYLRPDQFDDLSLPI